MKLSVLVPAYNLQDYIADCLLSVLNQQTTFDYQVIVCDDCSTDDTASNIATLVDQYPDKLKAIYKTKNAGLAANMLSLLACAEGEYVAYLDGDDIALPGKLQKQVDYLDQHPDCHMVYHESDMFDSQTNQTLKLYSQQFYNWDYIPQRSHIEHMIRYGVYMQASSVMFRHHPSLSESVATDCKIIFDYPFYILNAGYLNANIDFIPEVLGRYRIHPNSFGGQTSRSYQRREQCLADIELACQLARRFDVAEDVIEQGIAHHRFAAALYFLSRGEYALFQKYIRQSTDNRWFFNDKHEKIWRLAEHPDKAQMLLKEWG